MKPAGKPYFLIAAVLSLLGAIAHEVVGAPKVLGPLADTNLPVDVIWLHHFSWHVGTIAVLVMVYMFVQSARISDQAHLGIIATSISIAFSLLGIGLASFGSASLWTTPAPWAWTLVSLFGLLGCYKARSSHHPALKG
ncbi:MAG: hypothetical protein JJ850_00355 [Kordiimonadaceae bacterium]|nr:hypothetical protein [Kordiimonadaceae bacterium]MBO6567750.1 hypothetical protein [Kordiimonadaceae bacterium]MBO6963035.1 hypothetical protein [Kordiimonadaceae bacterium]